PHLVDGIVIANVGAPIDCGRKFDLALCLEVAEHLPESDAKVLVQNLCNAADTILFSAAIPGQVGTGHINAQWPSYWDAIFSEAGFECVDCMRQIIWNRADVELWYRQNVLLFIRRGTPRSIQQEASSPLNLVHPEVFSSVLKMWGDDQRVLSRRRLRNM